MVRHHAMWQSGLITHRAKAKFAGLKGDKKVELQVKSEARRNLHKNTQIV